VPAAYKYLSRASPVSTKGLDTDRPDSTDRAQVTVVLASRSSTRQRLDAIACMANQLPQDRRYLTCDELAERHGARRESATLVTDFASGHQLEVVETSLARRSVVLSGSLEKLSKAFGVEFVTGRHAHGRYRTFQGRIRIPTQLARHVSAVLGLTNRPVLRRDVALTGTETAAKAVDPLEMATRYDFPKYTGKGETIGTIVLGGGVYLDDVQQYLQARGSARPIQIVEVGTARNRPASAKLIHDCLKSVGLEEVHAAVRTVAQGKGLDPPGPVRLTPQQVAEFTWTLEATMDVELIAALAPGASITVYVADNSELGKFDALSRAICDPQGPSVISCSWGNEELEFTHEWMRLIDELFQMAALTGVTLCYSSGDDGDGTRDGGPPCAHFPASSPHVLACGGTNASMRGTRLVETVWSQLFAKELLESGGGVSMYFARPSWQAGARVPRPPDSRGRDARRGRGVPDVAAKANFGPGYDVRVAGVDGPFGGGTSAAAPLWAALTARLNEGLGARCGHLTPLLYARRLRGTTRDIVKGSNGAFKARPGWDACTGWGSPRGQRLMAALRGRRS
jgi:kumamolisin